MKSNRRDFVKSSAALAAAAAVGGSLPAFAQQKQV
jgi:anaerobic selenocysteine-containing dehydrogenase